MNGKVKGAKVKVAPSSGIFCPQPDPEKSEGLQGRWHSRLLKGAVPYTHSTDL